MKQCPACKREMKEHLLFCPYDGEPLIKKAERDPLLGTILDDKFRLEEKIGEGGMGKVYRAIHIHMDHTFAIKILHPHLASDQTALERFRREARAAAYIRHPNAVAVTDFGVTKDTGVAYIVMEFLEGLELREKIKQKKQLDYEESFIIVHQTCLALNAAHAKGIIHRDLKPDNIWLFKAEDGIEQVKVLDFGIAKLKSTIETSRLTQQGMIVGTPYYMSPEQCRGEELDARSDIYSMGVIVYEMLTGQVPFQAPTPIGVVLKHANELPRPLRELRSDIPVSIEEVVLRALNKHREQRQHSAIQLSQEFETAIYEAGIELKLLGTKTPQSPLTFSFPPAPYRTYSQQTGSEAIKADTTGTTSDPALAAADQAVPDRSTAASTARPTRSLFSRLKEGGDAGRRKLLYGFVGLVCAMVLIAAIIKWTASGPATNEVRNANVGSTTDVPAPPPAPPPGMVLIPAGTFTMGLNDSEEASEKPEHTVKVDSFYIDQYEVTVKDYYEFLRDKNRAAPKDWPAAWRNGRFTADDGNRPVTNVNWVEANEYAEYREKRLPTEQEWEYAARGTEKRLYPWGDRFDPGFANVKPGNLEVPENKLPDPAGSHQNDKSLFGVFDLAGNVHEWTRTDSYRYPNSSVTPKAGKIVRGGSYLRDEVYARTTTRSVLQPADRRKDVGFRCAKDVPPRS